MVLSCVCSDLLAVESLDRDTPQARGSLGHPLLPQDKRCRFRVSRDVCSLMPTTQQRHKLLARPGCFRYLLLPQPTRRHYLSSIAAVSTGAGLRNDQSCLRC